LDGLFALAGLETGAGTGFFLAGAGLAAEAFAEAFAAVS
jgi:hypothetical protein